MSNHLIGLVGIVRKVPAQLVPAIRVRVGTPGGTRRRHSANACASPGRGRTGSTAGCQVLGHSRRAAYRRPGHRLSGISRLHPSAGPAPQRGASERGATSLRSNRSGADRDLDELWARIGRAPAGQRRVARRRTESGGEGGSDRGLELCATPGSGRAESARWTALRRHPVPAGERRDGHSAKNGYVGIRSFDHSRNGDRVRPRASDSRGFRRGCDGAGLCSRSRTGRGWHGTSALRAVAHRVR